MDYCLDTDIIIEFFRGNEKICKKFRERGIMDNIFVTYITLCELFKGAYLSTNTFREMRNINNLLKSIEIVNFSVKSCELFGAIIKKLKKEGKDLNDADVIIASIAIANNLTLVTNNIKHFSRIKELKLESWI